MIIRWLLNTLVLLLVGYLTPGVSFSGIISALIAALLIGLMNVFIRPILILLTLPINLVTLGFFTLFINGFIFWLASYIVKGFDIANFSAAFWAALIYLIIVMIVDLLMAKRSN